MMMMMIMIIIIIPLLHCAVTPVVKIPGIKNRSLKNCQNCQQEWHQSNLVGLKRNL